MQTLQFKIHKKTLIEGHIKILVRIYCRGKSQQVLLIFLQGALGSLWHQSIYYFN